MITILKNGLNHAIDMDKLSNESIIIDAGAGRGGFIKRIRESVTCKIVCIECSRMNIARIKDQNFDNIILLENALVGTDAKSINYVEFYGDPSQGTDGYFEWGNIYGNHKQFLSQRGGGVGMNEYEVETTTLKELMDAHVLGNVDYLKMDIEGAEYDVLMGMDDPYLRRILQISVELHDKGRNNALVTRLLSAGFSHQELEKDEHYFSQWKD